MESNPFFMKFYETITEDFTIYKPDTTEEEKQALINRAMMLFSSNKIPKIINITFENDVENPIDTYSSKQQNNLFMFRALHTDAPVPHQPPEKYKMFYETSFNIYENYSKTIDYLNNKFYINDVISCREQLNTFTNGRILCWSNTNILLDHILKTSSKIDDLDILSFGSPILMPKYTNKCINLYHEDDWMLGFVSVLHKIDFSTIPRDKLVKCTFENGIVSEFVVISRNKFSEGFTLPHRYYYAFF